MLQEGSAKLADPLQILRQAMEEGDKFCCSKPLDLKAHESQNG